MMEVQQYSETRRVEVTVVYLKNQDAKEPVLVNIGGARSSKSHSIGQLMIKKFTEEKNKNLLTTRKTLPALRTTAYRVAVDLMKEYGCYYYFNHNKSERTIYNPYKNNWWLFTSIDDPEKIKSTEFNYVHMEEANEFGYDDYMILKLRMSGHEERGERNQMYLTLNPTQKHGWVNKELLPQKGVKVIHSTYEDAIEFLPKSYVAMLERLQKEDPTYWHVYGLGLFAEIKGIIHFIHVIPALPAEPIETIYGLDFGFVNPNALIQIDIDMENRALYLTELLYQTGMTNAQLKEKLKVLIPEEHRDREIYADSAEPARIEEISLEGFNIHKSDKSVTDGIDCVNRFKLYTTEESPNLIGEMEGYKRKVDAKGRVLEEPVKFNDHCPNALRYGAFTHLRDRLLTLEPAWTVHAGEKAVEDKDKAPPGVEEPTSAPVVAKPEASKPIDSEAPQGTQEKQGPKKGGDGGSWTV